jgi:hypothetical protein
MIQIHESSSSRHSYPKQALWIYFIPSNLFLLLPLMSVSVDLFLFLYFQDDIEYCCVLVLQEVFVGYDQTIANYVGLASLELVLPQVCPHNIIISESIFPCVVTYPTQHPYFSYTHLLDVLSFCSPTFCAIHHRWSNRRPVEFAF